MKSKRGLLQRQGLKIFKAGIRAVDPEKLVKKCFRKEINKLHVGEKVYPLDKIRRIIVVGAGKASARMARAVEDILKGEIHSGVVITKHGYLAKLRRIKLIQAGHPVPDKNGLRGTEKIIRLLKTAGKKDLVICLISGGGSSLLVSPVKQVSLEDKRKTTDLLLRCGAEIREINAIRKHLSGVKGGNLAKIVYPAKVCSLILSDVAGDRLDVIASGPTSADRSNFYQCLKIIRKYELSRKIPYSVIHYLKTSLGKGKGETPKPRSRFFRKVQNLIIGSNIEALRGCEKKAKRLGFKTFLLSKPMIGDNHQAARKLINLVKKIRKQGRKSGLPVCVICGGETTVKVTGKGLGGRNQELALLCAIGISKIKKVFVLSGSTDGTDGSTDAAGAFCDGNTVSRAEHKGLGAEEFLKNNDSYHFFKKVKGLVKTKPTGTNVMDIHLVLVG